MRRRSFQNFKMVVRTNVPGSKPDQPCGVSNRFHQSCFENLVNRPIIVSSEPENHIWKLNLERKVRYLGLGKVLPTFLNNRTFLAEPPICYLHFQDNGATSEHYNRLKDI